MRAYRHTALLAALLLAAGCDFTVTNPGPIQSKYLTDPAAVPALVAGAGRALSDAVNWIGYTGAAVAREIFPAGSTGSFGITVQQQNGKLLPEEVDDHWNRAQVARWTAEHGVAQIWSLQDTTIRHSKSAAQMLLWAGYANRLLGENMCDAVIDGGPRQDYTVYLTRAEQHFTDALAVATALGDATLANAARAGRASVRADLGDWAGAVADARPIADAFVYRMPYFASEEPLYNRIYYASANSPYRAHTEYHTYYESYYRTVHDPRVAWDSVATAAGTAQVGDAAVSVDGINGRVPWYFQTKYRSKDAAINLSSGWEMRLIEAEAALVAGDTATAMPLVDKHRVALGLAPWPAPASLDEAWQRLKRERGIELWLEARRLGDLRRWSAAGAPGAVEDNVANHDLCFPISNSELQTNPNLGQ